MDYKVILKDLADVTANVKLWEKQGYASTIEKDIALETLRRIYEQLCPDKAVDMDVESGAVEVYKEDRGLDSLIEFIKNSQMRFMTETSAQIAEIKETLAKGIAIQEPVASTKPEIEEKPDTMEMPAFGAKTAVEAKPIVEEKPAVGTEPVTDIKVDIRQEPCIIGFYSLPENMRYSIIRDLFNGDTSRAEIAVNKMCSLKSIDDLLIYVEERFQWSPTNATAASLIKILSKKFE